MDTNQILVELYELDPSLRSQEEQIKKIISELTANRPEIIMDPNFLSQLRERLAAKASEPKASWFSFFRQPKTMYSLAGVAVLVIIFLSYSAGQQNPGSPLVPGIINNNPSNQEQAKTTEEFALLPAQAQVEQAGSVQTFASKEEFVKYLQNSQAAQSFGYGRGGGMANSLEAVPAPMMGSDLSKSTAQSVPSGSEPDRYSTTNVQVGGIDEPDIVKTDGKNLFLSLQRPYSYYDYPMPLGSSVDIERSTPSAKLIAPPYNPPPQESQILQAFPVSELKKIGKIDKQGNLLLVDNILTIFTYEGIYGYDVKTPAEPKQLWYLKYENNSQLSSARLLNGKIYFVTQNNLNYNDPCPIRPLSLSGKMVEIACPQIYHPIAPIPDSITYNAFSINPKTGEVQNKLSFVGSTYSTTIYMSNENLYVTYVVQPDMLALMVDFLKTKGSGILPSSVMDRLNKLQTYDISPSAKMTEMGQILEKYNQGLSQDERLTKENDINNKMSEYIKENSRKLMSTGIVKIKLDGLKLEKTGQVPGTLLNQFSLDEYKGNLRVATTIGGNGFWWGWGFGGGQNESVNDVYVLNGNLEVAGSVKDLGKTERIYSARFIEDKGYLVTFRQTDPFYVLDLKDAKNPRVAGELKIPGFSSYLHPLEKNRILGVGQENGQVKLSLFDVSDASNPKEIDKYQLKEYWSEASSNHHAFLQDDKHKVFFLPAGQNGYVFGYADGKLTLKKAIASYSAKRAIYIDNSLYIISDDKIIVLDENSWEKVKEISL